jgi:hypothetical protein
LTEEGDETWSGHGTGSLQCVIGGGIIAGNIQSGRTEEIESVLPELQFERSMVDFDKSVLIVTKDVAFGYRILEVRLIDVDFFIAPPDGRSWVRVLVVVMKGILVKTSIMVNAFTDRAVDVRLWIGMFAVVAHIDCRRL